MYDRFDNALSKALTSEHAQYGISERRSAVATARRAAAENRVKSLNEASLGHTGFARVHDTASTRFHEDAEEMILGHPPLHHSIGFYLSTALAYCKADAREEKLVASPARKAA